MFDICVNANIKHQMPNHITNILTAIGSKSDLEKIFIPDTNFSFAHTIPPPSTDDNFDWYTWNCDNWGTKWDAYESIISYNYDINPNPNIIQVDITFLTAWSAPYAWLGTVSRTYPDVKFTLLWSDEDYPSCGKLIAKDGISETESEIYGHNSGSQAIEFMEEHFPDIYDIYKYYNLNLILNESIQHIHPNIRIEMTDFENDTDQIFELIMIDDNGNHIGFDSLESKTRIQIYNKVKKEISEHGYQTKRKNNEFYVISKSDDD